jgi:hypothetical protein
MSRSNLVLPFVAFVGLVLFGFAFVHVLLLRYERGDIYPAYSTLRADPLGARAYYEALDSVSGYSSTRGFSYLHQELAEKPATLVYLGFDSDELSSFSKDEVAQLDDYVRNGGRLILTMSPDRSLDISSRSDESKKKADEKKDDAKKAPADQKPKDAAPEEKDDTATAPQTEQEKWERDALRKEKEEYEKDVDPNPPPSEFRYHPSIAASWGFGWDNTHEKPKAKSDSTATKSASDDDDEDDDVIKEENKPEVMALHTGADGLEASVPWKSAIYFLRLEPEWQVLYRAKSQPVLIQRKWGHGEIIVATDSYFISNEALRNNRSPALLAMLAGPSGNLLFDETHLGTQRQEGVMFLVNKFRLEGYLYGTLAVMVLFLWRNSMPLVPPPVRQASVLGGAISGKDSRSGLVNLLRRNIGQKEILPASFAEWKRTVTPAQSHLHEKMAAMDTTLSSTELKRPEQIVETYHHLREINTSRNKESYATKS